MECPDNEGSIPFLDTKCTQNPNHTSTHHCVQKTHTYRQMFGLEFQPPNYLQKVSVIQTLTHRAKMVCSIPWATSKGGGLSKQSSAQEQLPWMVPQITWPQASYGPSHQPQKPPRNLLSQYLYIQGLSEEYRRIFKDNKVQIILKGWNNTLNSVNASTKTTFQHSFAKMWHLSVGPVLMRTAILFTLENQALILRKQGQGTQYFIYQCIIFQHCTILNHL